MIPQEILRLYVQCKWWRVLCILFVLSLPLNSLKAQNKNIDSLLVLLKKDNPDSTKIYVLLKLADIYSYQNPDSAIYFAECAKNIAEKIKDDKQLANALSEMGWDLFVRGDYSEALKYCFKALKIDEGLKNKKGMAQRLGFIGTIYRNQGDYPQALNYYFEALKMTEELGDNMGIGAHFANIGNVYYTQVDYSKAMDYYFKSLKIFTKLGNKNGVITALMNIGNVYNDLVNFPQALDYYFKALEMAEKLENKSYQAIVLGNIGTIYYDKKDYPKALNYYFKALKLNEDLNNENGLAINFGNIGELYIETGNFKEAEQYLKRAITIDESIGALDLLRQTEENLFHLYDTTGRFQLALIHYKKAMVLKDTLFSQENKKQLVSKEMNYQFDKKEAITKAETEKQQAIAEEKNRKQKIISLAVGSGLLLVLVFAGFVFRSLRITNRQKKIIESQKFQIVESINYSKKIQNSLLPNVSEMQKEIKGLFVFYEPKDIVSGDFYYFKKFEKYTLIACVDCTGHGVPGGFMSTMGSLLLDKIVNSELLSPAEILNKLSEEVVRVLHQQDGGEIQDGMDLCICLIDHENKKIEFSGARNGIIIISDGQAKRYKADLLPVGGNYMKKGVPIDRKFKTQTIDINQNDWIYMYTDGFMEQVGGGEGVPMNYLQFENQLIRVSKKQGPEEKNKFLQTQIDNWRGKHERDDDILIMGFQIV